ncbi:hypothetical protein [Sphingobacterium bovistauri]|uniref:Uncharacterized protein n=1 Tax=Sphingobacterium bovistauri TaxID=2781959 RepID=A0ABS7Z5P2_9SPHI|nr:hypothetical protein [Sphingobacterium bovistauri]MCA5005513.1 hypothetical protein [Sphingobacterium bovistauri]
MKNKNVKYITPKISLELIMVEDPVCNGSIVVNPVNSYPHVNDWEDGYGETVNGGRYDL